MIEKNTGTLAKGFPEESKTFARTVPGRPWKILGGWTKSCIEAALTLPMRMEMGFPSARPAPTVGAGEVVAGRASDALELAGQKIEEADEEKSAEELEIERAIKE